MYEAIKRFAKKSPLCERIIYCGFLCYGVLYNIFCRALCLVFPIEKQKICCSAKGRYYADNPKYISEALLADKKDVDIVWIIPKEKASTIPAGMRWVESGTFSALKELLTSAVWIESSAKQYGFYKRKGTRYLQTTHGSYGIKKIGIDLVNNSLVDKKLFPYNARHYDLMVTNSRKMTEIMRRAFQYDGKILEYGSPRNDIFFRDPKPFKEKIMTCFGTQGKRLALYAPTWRSNFNTGFLSMDYERILGALHTRFGGEWVLLLRMHPHNTEEAKKLICNGTTILNATDYDDMQELLVASDVLITDYSSCMFDFITTVKPCFLYAPDVEEYRNDRDYYFDIYDLPFPLGRDTQELEAKILAFDEQAYAEKVKALHEQVGLNETGHASEAAARYIEDWIAKGMEA